MASSWALATYDDSGYNNYTNMSKNAVKEFNQATVLAGLSSFLLRLERRLISTN